LHFIDGVARARARATKNRLYLHISTLKKGGEIMNQEKNVGAELTDEQLMEMTGGASFVDAASAGARIVLLYGIFPIAFYGIIARLID